MHFFNPATVMKLVEVILAPKPPTRLTHHRRTRLRAWQGARRGQRGPGFVVNKILIPLVNEGIDLVYTGVASPSRAWTKP